MKTIAIYNLKGGVGKTTFALNLSWCSAQQSRRRTLLWDLDPQAAATWLIAADTPAPGQAQSIFSKEAKPEKLARPSTVEGLDLIAADMSLRGIERFLFDLSGHKRLTKLIERLDDRYDRVILDCPPGLGEVAEQVLRAADLVIVPVIPAPLSERAFADVAAHLSTLAKKGAALLPVYSMLDRRRALHKQAMERHPDWPIVPMASAVEQTSARRKPLGAFAPTSPAAKAFSALWTEIERKLAKG